MLFLAKIIVTFFYGKLFFASDVQCIILMWIAGIFVKVSCVAEFLTTQ